MINTLVLWKSTTKRCYFQLIAFLQISLLPGTKWSVAKVSPKRHQQIWKESSVPASESKDMIGKEEKSRDKQNITW